MKKAIGILHNPDSGESPMTIYYNGLGEKITAENDKIIEHTGYVASDEEDARNAARCFWGSWPWEYEELK